MKQPLFLSSLCSLLLVACGGGGGGTASSSPSPSPASLSATTASDLGAAAISPTGDTETFDMVASIGDTWRLAVNKSSGAFTVTPNNSMYSLTAESGSLTRTVSGDFVTYSLPNRINLIQDTRTKSVSGSMTVGGQTASVAGTQYQLGNTITSLQGTYNFLGSSRNRNPSGGNFWPEVMGGQLKINADGTGKFCASGKFVGSTCTPIDQSSAAEEVNARFTKDTTPNGGFVKVEIWSTVTNSWLNFGNLMIHPGDFGPAFMIDHFGLNEEGVSRVGNYFAVKAQTLTDSSANGVWKCDTPSGSATLTINGTLASINSPNETPATWTEILSFNKVNSDNLSLVSLDGFMNMAGANNQGSVILPLSSSIAVIEHSSASRVGICYKAQ